MERIVSSDNAQTIVLKMSDGNPGAIAAMMDLLKDCGKIDPNHPMGPFGPLLMLDTLGIYGTGIYILWNDKCERDTRRFILLLRATQLGLLPMSKMQEMAADQMRQINLSVDEWADLDLAVCNRLEKFMSPESWATLQQGRKAAELAAER